MSGAVITGTSTTLGVEKPAGAIDPRIAEQVKVYTPGVADVDVVLDLTGPSPVGSGYRGERLAVVAMTRDEALNLVRAIQRALGINPDAQPWQVAAIDDIREVLYPAGDPDAEWQVETIEYVADALNRHDPEVAS